MAEEVSLAFIHQDARQYVCGGGHWFAVRRGAPEPVRCPFGPCEATEMERVGAGSRGPRKKSVQQT